MSSKVLRELYETDQADRLSHPIDWAVVAPRDWQRRLEVRRLLAAGEAQDGWDHYWAAFVLVHTRDIDDLEESLRLSRRAIELDPNTLQFRALYPIVKDRLLWSRGELQWYGTQKIIVNGELELAPVDPLAVTDEERRAMGVLTLAERKKEIDQINIVRAEQRRRTTSSTRQLHRKTT
jgi:hypothetical protein